MAAEPQKTLRTRFVGLVTGPLQAISAVEAFHHFRATGPVFYYSVDRPVPGIFELFERAGVDLRWLPRAARLERARGFLGLLPTVMRGGRLMIGSLYQRPFLGAAALARRELVLLDDGAGTGELMARRVAGTPSRSRLGRRVDERPLIVFSIYSPAVKAGDRLVPSRLAHVRSLFSGPTRLLDEAWIVGQPFVDSGMMGEADYISLLRPFATRMRAEASGVLYIQHPRESASAAERVCSQLQLRRTVLPAPIELVALGRRELPRNLFSISSAVLDTLPLLSADFPSGFQLWTSRDEPSITGPTSRGIVPAMAAVRAGRDLRIA